MLTPALRRLASTLSVIALLTGVLASCSLGDTAKLTLVNKSGQDIDMCSITLSGRTVSAGRVKAGQRVSVRFSVNEDAHYDVTLQFANGKRLQQGIGYVTPGFKYDDTAEIHDDRIVLLAGNIRKS